MRARATRSPSRSAPAPRSTPHARVIERSVQSGDELIADGEPPEDSEALADWLESLDDEDLGDSQ